MGEIITTGMLCKAASKTSISKKETNDSRPLTSTWCTDREKHWSLVPPAHR